jgi:hypothetical protein
MADHTLLESGEGSTEMADHRFVAPDVRNFWTHVMLLLLLLPIMQPG